jgi:hypothetical protein
LFFLLPFAYGSIFGIVILVLSLLLKKYYKPSISKIPAYVGIVAGIGTIYYSLEAVRGFEGMFVGLIGISIIIWSVFIIIFFSVKKQKDLNM